MTVGWGRRGGGGGVQASRRIPTAEGVVGVSDIKPPPRARVRPATAGDVPPAAFETVGSRCC